jgi:proline iminopeptidase
VFGGSWGSTLALAYAQRHPERVTELVLRGIFLLRRSELEWFYQDSRGAASIFPDLWEKYLAPIPPAERADMMQAYYRRLLSEDRATRAAAARAWATWEGATSFLRTNPAYVAKFDDPDYAAAFARIEAHYFVNRGFMDSDDQLLRDVEHIRHIPAVIVQGRYDVVCTAPGRKRSCASWRMPATRRSSRPSRANWSRLPTACYGVRAPAAKWQHCSAAIP